MIQRMRWCAIAFVMAMSVGCAGGETSTSTTVTAMPVPTSTEQLQAESHHRHHHHHATHGAVRTPSPHAAVATGSAPSGVTCDNAAFSADQSGFASGSISGDQFVDVCGSVTSVLPARKTRSGNHGYFNVQLPSGAQIEIVSNLDAMAQARSNAPPSTWPWVSVGQYVYVQGRYYYDNASRQGIDWTEDDTSRSWPHVGYVMVCASPGTDCLKYW